MRRDFVVFAHFDVSKIRMEYIYDGQMSWSPRPRCINRNEIQEAQSRPRNFIKRDKIGRNWRHIIVPRGVAKSEWNAFHGEHVRLGIEIGSKLSANVNSFIISLWAGKEALFIMWALCRWDGFLDPLSPSPCAPSQYLPSRQSIKENVAPKYNCSRSGSTPPRVRFTAQPGLIWMSERDELLPNIYPRALRKGRQHAQRLLFYPFNSLQILVS